MWNSLCWSVLRATDGPRSSGHSGWMRPGQAACHGGFLGSVNLSFYLSMAESLWLLEWARSLATGSIFGSRYGRRVTTTKSKPRQKFSLRTHCPSKPHQPKHLIQWWFIVMRWLLPELPAVDILNKCLLFQISLQHFFLKSFQSLFKADFPNDSLLPILSLENLYMRILISDQGATSRAEREANTAVLKTLVPPAVTWS